MVALGVVARAVVDRPQDRQPIHPPGLLGQELAEMDSRVRWWRSRRTGRGIRRGASGLGSQVSMWPGPPLSQNRMTLLPALVSAHRPHGSNSQQIGQRQSADPKDARLEEAAPRDPIAIPCAPPKILSMESHSVNSGWMGNSVINPARSLHRLRSTSAMEITASAELSTQARRVVKRG